MKTTIKHIVKIVLISSIFLSLSSYAQAPQKMSYQAVLRNASNALVSNTPVAIRVSVLQGSASGTAVYVERHTVTTNVNGLATFEIGSGTLISGSFSGINWASGVYFVKTETDPAGGTNYTISGTSQLLSVPYALYAKAVDGVSATNTTNWNSAFSWGNHSGLYRPVTYVPDWSEVTNKPVLDGSETKVTAGANVTVTGAGTTASPFVINSTGTSGAASPQWTTVGDNIWNTNTGNIGIGVTDPEYKLDLGGRMRIRGTPGNRAGLFLNNEANTASPAFVGMQSDERVGFFGSGIGWSFIVNTTNGNVGIGTFNSAAKLEVNGFTKLGSDAPAIKYKKLTGTTAATDWGSVSIPHGLPLAKILSVSVLLVVSSQGIPPFFTGADGFEYNYYIDQTHIWILNKANNSVNILSKPVTILITYEE